LALRAGRTLADRRFQQGGEQLGTAGPPSPINHIRLSPDETRLLGASEDGGWLFEPNQPGRLSLGREFYWQTWSTDGLRIMGTNGRGVGERAVNSSDRVHELKFPDNFAALNVEVSASGKVLLVSGPDSIISVGLDGTAEERAPKLLIQTGDLTRYVKLSPDGHWMVYLGLTPNQGGGIYVQPFPGPGLRKQIASTTFDCRSPIWSKDGKEILYYDQSRIWSVPVDGTDREFRAGAQKALFTVRAPVGSIPASTVLDVSRDGSRIYYLQPVEEPDADVINVRMGLWK
jgi:Tol biopolymer transport system component